jgi:hypothetical protein
MNTFLKLSCLCSLLATTSLNALAQEAVASGNTVALEPDTHGWFALFDGKTLSGWKTFDPGGWTVEADSVLVGRGPRSHLFSPNRYRNLEFRAEIKLNAKGNSGMYFRAELMPGWPKGYEAQVENTSSDPQRTGSLYNFKKNLKQLVPDDTWWTQHIIAIGNRIIIKVNDTIVVDHVEDKNTHIEGHLALQQHDPGSVVQYRRVSVKPLPNDAAAALAIAKQDMPDIGKEPLVK